MITITSLRRTCPAIPSQWEGTVDDGRTILIHYRNAILSISDMYPGTPGETRYRFDDIFRTTLTEKNFVDADDEPYDDGFAEFRTIRAVLVNAGVITISDDVDIPDDF